MSSEQDSKPFGRNTCHICGGTAFTWSKFSTASSYTDIVPEDAGWLDRVFRENSTPRLRVCDNCGNVQLFLKRDEK